MKHLQTFALLVFALSLPACATFDGLKRDTNKLWTSIGGTQSAAPVQNGTPQSSLTTAAASSTCPPITIMPDLRTLNEFLDPAKPDDKTLISEFSIVNVESECTQYDGTMSMRIEFYFTGKLGPKARANKNDKPSFAYPYFIAVTDSSGQVLAKEIFASSVSYAAGQNELNQIESITQTLPIKSEKDILDYKVLVGFQLDEYQLTHSRGKANP